MTLTEGLPRDGTVIVIGASLGGLRATETLRDEGFTGKITLVGEELHLPYDRPPLSKQVLAGTWPPEKAVLADRKRAGELQIHEVLGHRAVRLDAEKRQVEIDDGTIITGDALVIATGASPRHLPGTEGLSQHDGLFTLRTLDDSLALRAAVTAVEGCRVVVIGAGFIGLEVAASAHQRGLQVSVLEALPVPLERAIGAEMGAALARWHRAHGIDLRVGVGVEAVEGSGRPEGVRLSDGTVVPADVVVVGVGVSPTTGWLEGSGVDLDDGVACDESLRVLVRGRPVPDVVAAGDVARWAHGGYGRRVRLEHWTNAAEQGEAAGHTLITGDASPAYRPTPYFWSDQHGVKIQFVGQTDPGDEVALVEGSFDDSRLVAAYGRNGKLVAALGMRRPARIMALQALIEQDAPFPPPE